MIKRLTIDEFIKKARKTHGDKYDYSNVVYITARIPVIINCPTHGDFSQTPDNHIRGQKCPKCSIIKRAKIRSSTIEEFVKKSNELHDNKYDYSKVIYTNCDAKVIIICPIHGDFLQSPYCHLDGKECPMCNVSRGEARIIKFLDKNKLTYNIQQMFPDCRNPKTKMKLKYDFYIPSKNLLIEYDGEQHFNVITSRRYKMTKEVLDNNIYKDSIKTQYAKTVGIELLRIKYTDFSKIEDILTDALK